MGKGEYSQLFKIMNQNFTKNAVKRSFTLFAMGVLLTLSVVAQLPTAQTIADKMKIGWNLGNSLESTGGETAWGNPLTTQAFIDTVKAAGFNTIRLPVAWDSHANATTHVIDSTWIARVKEVVDYCINADMYVIVNIHWDGGWLENNVTTTAQSAVNIKQQAYWTQIANYFKDYDEHLLFASANEPNVSDTAGMTVLLSYHQTFINAVRATGGNNSSRTLIIQGPSTDIATTYKLMTTLPTDVITNRMIAEIHYYTPWNFCGLEADASWGKMFYYWGSGYHSTTDITRNATWGEETEMEYYFGLMKTQFVDKGIPVILGEFGAMKRSTLTGADLTLHLASRQYYHEYLVSSAIGKGIIPIYWDNGGNWGIFNRSTGAVTDQGNLISIMQGAGDTTTYSATGVTINFTSASIAVGGTKKLTSVVFPSYATNKNVNWGTSNSSIAKVDSTGLVTGVAAGSATITATTVDGSITATCSVTVTGSTLAKVNEEVSVVIYPNPIEEGGLLIIEGLKGNSAVRIIDMNGRVVKQEIIANQFAKIEVNLKPGIYIFQAINTERTIVKKIIVK
jgi:aryl-phospho-beta-D-glucosidase BglC (GH1 family)